MWNGCNVCNLLVVRHAFFLHNSLVHLKKQKLRKQGRYSGVSPARQVPGAAHVQPFKLPAALTHGTESSARKAQRSLRKGQLKALQVGQTLQRRAEASVGQRSRRRERGTGERQRAQAPQLPQGAKVVVGEPDAVDHEAEAQRRQRRQRRQRSEEARAVVVGDMHAQRGQARGGGAARQAFRLRRRHTHAQRAQVGEAGDGSGGGGGGCVVLSALFARQHAGDENVGTAVDGAAAELNELGAVR